MPPIRNLSVTLSVLVLAACGGGDDGAATTTAPPASTTTTTTTTTAPTTSSVAESSTTTEASTTSEPAPAEITPDELAAAIVLPTGFFGGEWGEAPRDESDFAYVAVEGCGFVDGLIDDDGKLAEAESPTFSQLDTEIEHDVRVYTSVGHATDVVLAWAEQDTIQCLADGASIQAQEDLDSGALEPFTGYEFEITLFDDHIGEPRITNLEIANNLTGPDGEVLVYVDVYFVQVGRTVSRLEVVNPGAPWDQTQLLLDELVARMAGADPAAA